MTTLLFFLNTCHCVITLNKIYFVKNYPPIPSFSFLSLTDQPHVCVDSKLLKLVTHSEEASLAPKIEDNDSDGGGDGSDFGGGGGGEEGGEDDSGGEEFG